MSVITNQTITFRDKQKHNKNVSKPDLNPDILSILHVKTTGNSSSLENQPDSAASAVNRINREATQWKVYGGTDLQPNDNRTSFSCRLKLVTIVLPLAQW
jgi:hypothetical protein